MVSFFSSLICEKEGVEEIIDTRTSDAIAIAVRFEAPIYTYEKYFRQSRCAFKYMRNWILMKIMFRGRRN